MAVAHRQLGVGEHYPAGQVAVRTGDHDRLEIGVGQHDPTPRMQRAGDLGEERAVVGERFEHVVRDEPMDASVAAGHAVPQVGPDGSGRRYRPT
jgi:hypothetical protein